MHFIKTYLEPLWTSLWKSLSQFGRKSFQEKIKYLINHKFAGAGILIISSFFENFFNFLYNAYLGRVLKVEDFGLISLFGSFLFLVKIPSSALARTVTHKTAFIFGKYKIAIKLLWAKIRKNTIYISLIGTCLWILLIPFLKKFFHADSTEPFILFAPVWLIGLVSAVDSGFLGGNLKFLVLAVLAVVYSLCKILFSVIFVTINQTHLVYAATPLSMLLSFLIGWYFANSVKKADRINLEKIDKKDLKFPTNFFLSSIIIKLSEILFFTLDIILAKHFLSPVDAGRYALVSMVGKMIFFIGGLFGQFILPVISKEEGAARKENSKRIFYKLFLASTLVSFCGYIMVGIFGKYTGPILFGSKIHSVAYLLPIYGLAMLGFQIADNVISFEQARNKHFFAYLSLILALLQFICLSIFHETLDQYVYVMTAIGILNFVVIMFFHFKIDLIERIEGFFTKL